MRLFLKVCFAMFVMLVIVFVYSFIGLVSLKPLPTTSNTGTISNNQYSGVIHVHSLLSDGGSSIKEIAAQAENIGLDFIIITDHGAGPEARLDAGYYGNVLVMIASEISTEDGHFLYIPHPDSLFYDPDYVQKCLFSLGDEAIIIGAHPDLKSRLLSKDAAFRVDGIEAVNADTQWRNSSKIKLIQSIMLYPFSSYSMNLLPNYPEKSMAMWKEILSQRDDNYIMIGSADAHSKIDLYKSKFWKFPPYVKLFEMIQTHVNTKTGFTGEYSHDARIIYDALKAGNSFITFENYGDTNGFLFSASVGGSWKSMGEYVDINDMYSLNVSVPTGKDVRIYIKTPEKTVSVHDSPEIVIRIEEKGKYFVEVYQLRSSITQKGMIEVPWIITNAIIVR